MQIVAHRGIHQTHPENSLEAFLEAWGGGLTWCECDVHASSDGVPMVMHDPTLDRTSNAKGPIVAQSAKTLTSVRLKTTDGFITDATLPTLEQVMDKMPAGCAMLVEIKPDPCTDKLAKRVAEILKGKNAIIQSFNPAALLVSRKFDHEHEHVLLVGKNDKWEPGAWDGINLQHELAMPDLIDMLKRNGKKWGVWTVNQPADIRRVLALNPDAIISDDPRLVSRLQSETSK